MSFDRTSDESVTAYYKSIRRQVEADQRHKHHFTANPSVRDRAEKLREETDRRKLQYPRKQRAWRLSADRALARQAE